MIHASSRLRYVPRASCWSRCFRSFYLDTVSLYIWVCMYAYFVRSAGCSPCCRLFCKLGACYCYCCCWWSEKVYHIFDVLFIFVVLPAARGCPTAGSECWCPIQELRLLTLVFGIIASHRSLEEFNASRKVDVQCWLLWPLVTVQSLKFVSEPVAGKRSKGWCAKCVEKGGGALAGSSKPNNHGSRLEQAVESLLQGRYVSSERIPN